MCDAITLNQSVFFVRPEAPERLYGATVTGLPDALDPAYAVRLPDGSSHRAHAESLATDPGAARAIQRAALLERVRYFEAKVTALRAQADRLADTE